MSLSRRDLLRMAGVGVIALPLVACSGGGGPDVTGSQLTSTAKLPVPFRVPLPIPPVLQPVSTDGGVDRYQITQKAVSAEILPGLRTEVWGYNGIFPGPTIESRSGRQIVVNHTNQLPVPTVVHLHGGRTPHDQDGYPTDLLLPVSGWPAGDTMGGMISHGSRDYVYPLQQRAMTLWYHDHRMAFTGPQVYRGLAGFHIIRDDEDDALPLPKGDHEIPLMICDRAFNSDGSFQYPSSDPTLHDTGLSGGSSGPMQGVLGDVVLVNGVPWPYLEVTNTRYRFRILNSSNARRYRLTLDPPPQHGSPFVQVGSDGGLLAAPINQSHLDVAQAERFDVVVDFSAYPVGTQVTLTNGFGTGSTAQVMRFHITGKATDDSSVPPKLGTVAPLPRSAAGTTRKFKFSQGDKAIWMVNNKEFDPNRDDATPKLGDTEIWQLTTDAHHPVHVHLTRFQILTRNGQAPGPLDAGWKDTIDLGSGETAEIIMTFDGYRGRYVFHCHNLEHEDMAMMANFQVT